MGIWRPGGRAVPAGSGVGVLADRASPAGDAQLGLATLRRSRVQWPADTTVFVIGGNARRTRSQPGPATTVTLLRSVPAVKLRSVPVVRLRSVPAAGLRCVPAARLRCVPAARLGSVPVVGLRSVPVVVGPSTPRAAPGTTGFRLLGSPVLAGCA